MSTGTGGRDPAERAQDIERVDPRAVAIWPEHEAHRIATNQAGFLDRDRSVAGKDGLSRLFTGGFPTPGAHTRTTQCRCVELTRLTVVPVDGD